MTPLAASYARQRELLAETEGWERFWSVPAHVVFPGGDVLRLHWYATRSKQPDVLVQIEMIPADDAPPRVSRCEGLAAERWTEDES